MKSQAKRRPVQFSLRSLLAGLTWFALILAICVQYQRTAARQRQAIDALSAGGWFPAAQVPAPRQPGVPFGAPSAGERPR